MVAKNNDRGKYATHERDDFVIPPYDPTIPDDERARLKAKYNEEYQKAIEKAVASMKVA